VILWHETGDPAPVEHLANQIQKVVGGVGVLSANLGVDGLDVRGDDGRGRSPMELRQDVAFQA